MHLRKQKGKGAAIDGIMVKKSSELLGMVHMILFSPEDLSIIKNGPGERRRFLDMELCQLGEELCKEQAQGITDVYTSC